MAKNPKNKPPKNKADAKHAAEKNEAASYGDIHPFAVPFLWLGRKSVIENFMWLPLLGMIVMIILGVVYPPHHPAPWDIVPGSWAIIGFTAYTIIVLSARPLFALLSRPEDYYGEGGLADPEYSTEHTSGDHHD